MKIRLLAFFCFFASLYSAQAQDFHIGIRAGLNYSTYGGEKEATESFGFNNGFHFGIYYGREINDFLSIRGSIMYTQKGGTRKYDGEGYYIFDRNSLLDVDGNFASPGVAIVDSLSLDLDISNAYVQIPITAHIKFLDKWEIYGGAYVGFSISPIATGVQNFGTRDFRDTSRLEYSFEQSLSHNYYGDNESDLQDNAFFNSGIGSIRVRVNGNNIEVPEVAGAYNQLLEKPDNLYKVMDYGLTGGISYYLNQGLFFNLQLDYGLRDLTNMSVDRSLGSLNEDGSFKLRDDFDRNIGLEFGIGFKF